MKRFAVVFGLVMLVGACNKPSEESCRKAISNFRSILGTENPLTDIEGDIRRCKGGSSKKSVECAINAKSVDELRACGFLKVPEKAGAPSGTPGSGAAPTPGPMPTPTPTPAPTPTPTPTPAPAGSAAAPAPTPGSGAAK